MIHLFFTTVFQKPRGQKCDISGYENYLVIKHKKLRNREKRIILNKN